MAAPVMRPQFRSQPMFLVQAKAKIQHLFLSTLGSDESGTVPSDTVLSLEGDHKTEA